MRLLLFLLFYSCWCAEARAQLSFDSLPSSSGLAGILMSGPFSCPGKNQKVKFPPQFYEESKKEQVLEIAYGKILKEVPCISNKKDFHYYSEAKHYCEWWFPMSFIPSQCDKWKRAGARGASPQFRSDFYAKLMKIKNDFAFAIPDLSFHYFYLDKDSIPNLAVYDCTDGMGARTAFLAVERDSIRMLDSIYGYAYDVRPLRNGLFILTDLRWKEDQFTCHASWRLAFGNGKLNVYDSAVVVSLRGMRIPQYTMDRKFFIQSVSPLRNGPSVDNANAEVFPSGSCGYVLGEESDFYFVAMLNNLPTEKEVFRKFAEGRMKKKIGLLYSLGWMKKEKVTFK